MAGRIIFFIIIIVFIFTANASDFDSLLNGGEYRYFQRFPGVLYTIFALMMIPLAFDLEFDEGGLWVIIILEAIYITIYTWLYFRIRKRKEEERIKRRNKIKEDRMNRELDLMKKTENSIVVKDEEVQNEKQNEKQNEE